MFSSGDEVLRYIQSEGVQFVDVRFCDLPGTVQHFTIPAENFGESVFSDGLMFDGSSIRGFQEIHESDMLLMADPSTAVIDPFRTHKTLNLTFFVHDPLTGEPYTRDPRNIARKAQDYLRGSGIADTAYFGPEAEFYIFDSARYQTGANEGYYHIDSIEGAWNTGRDEPGGNLGYKPRYKGGYFPVPPMDHYTDLRSEMVRKLDRVRHRGRDAAPRGRHRRPGGDRHPVLAAADHGRQPDALQVRGQERGQGGGQDRHVHAQAAVRRQRLGHALPPEPVEGRRRRCSTTRPATPGCRTWAGTTSAACSSTRRRCWPSPIRRPTRYHRLVPGYEAPVNLVYSQRNRSACVRIPITGPSPKAKRLEFRVPDPSANPYLAFSAMLMAGLDGIKNKIEPPEPVDKDLYELPPDEAKAIPQVPGSLEKVLDNLEADHEFLLEGGVFTPDLIETWLDYKRTNELDPMRLRPHPHEFELYYDV